MEPEYKKVYHFNQMGAVLLVNEDRIANIYHYNVLKMAVGGGSRPSFHSYAGHCFCQGAVPDSDTDKRIFIGVPAETSHTDAMARSTGLSRHLSVGCCRQSRQSSPVLIFVFLMLIPLEHLLWFPSMLTPVSGSVINVYVLEGEVLTAQNIEFKVLAGQGRYARDD